MHQNDSPSFYGCLSGKIKFVPIMSAHKCIRMATEYEEYARYQTTTCRRQQIHRNKISVFS